MGLPRSESEYPTPAPIVMTASLGTPIASPNQHSYSRIESRSLNTRVGMPVACCTSALRSTTESQYRNGANVTKRSSSICPPSERPIAVGAGAPGETTARTMRAICATIAPGERSVMLSVISPPIGRHIALTSEAVIAPS